MTSDVGSAAICESASSWPERDTEAEDEIFRRLTELRIQGHACGGDPARPQLPVHVVPELRCAARLHAFDLVHHDRLDHLGTGNRTPFLRLVAAGYTGLPRHELLAADFTAVEDVWEAWLARETTCRALLDGLVEEVGTGVARDERSGLVRWVVLTGEVRP